MEACPICGEFVEIDWTAALRDVRRLYPWLKGRTFKLVIIELAHWQHGGERRWDAEFLAACRISID